jgi:hypothetical protein
MRKFKVMLSLMLSLFIVTVSIPYNASAYQDPSFNNDINKPRQLKITNDEYKAYEKYGIMLSEDFTKGITKELKFNKIKNILKDQIILSAEKLDNGVYFETYQYDNINKLLPDFESIIEISLIKDKDFDRYCITYNTVNNEYVNLEYYNNGLETIKQINK